MSQPESLVDLTRRQFDLSKADLIDVQPILKGGSDRSFYRIKVGNRSLILVRYSGHKEENQHYVTAADFLEEVGVRVPHIFYHDEKEGLIWMQDLGERDLWTLRDNPSETKLAYYKAALQQVFIFHSKAMAFLPGSNVVLQKEFNEELYRWEQHYFLQNCVGRYFNIPEPEWNQLYDSHGMLQLAQGLAALPRVLVHRDFQSQNVMVLDEEIYLIDFQGMRPGVAQYDIASLLYDPYIELGAAEREELLSYYINLLSEETSVNETEFRDIYYRAAAQRLMQALGAYGYLGIECEKERFLSFIPIALPRLAEVLEHLDTSDLRPLREFVGRLQSAL